MGLHPSEEFAYKNGGYFIVIEPTVRTHIFCVFSAESCAALISKSTCRNRICIALLVLLFGIGKAFFCFCFNKRLEKEAAGKQEVISIGSFPETKNNIISICSFNFSFSAALSYSRFLILLPSVCLNYLARGLQIRSKVKI